MNNTLKQKTAKMFFVTNLFIKIFRFFPCFFTVVNVQFSFLGHSKGIHKVIGTWNTEETRACTLGWGEVLTSVDTVFISKKQFFGE